MDKIVIIGSSGAGKSTLARNLGSVLQIKVFHLDRFFWGRYWKEKDSYTRKGVLEKIVFTEKRWIIEGSYLASSEAALNEADTIIFLDLPPRVCLWRVIKRHYKYRGTPRRDIPEGCTDRFSLFHLLKMLIFPFRRRKKVKQTLYNYHSKYVRLSSTKKVNYFLFSCEKTTTNTTVFSSLNSAGREKDLVTTQYPKPPAFITTTVSFTARNKLLLFR